MPKASRDRSLGTFDQNMKRQDFDAAVDKVTAEENRGQWLFLAVYVGGIIAVGLPFSRIPEQYWWAHIIGIIALFAWILGPIPFLLRAAKKRAERNGLQCPHCGRHFLGPDRKVVLAGGNCCFCGDAIIEK